MEDMLKTLTRRSFAASRARNWIAVLAIALTAVLFTAIATIALGTMESFTLTLQMQKMSRSDGDIRYMTAEQFESLGQADFIRTAGLRMPVAYLSNAVRHNIEFNVQDEIQAELTFCAPTHGRTPAAPNEVVASDLALRDLGVEPEEGAEITVTFTAHGQDYALPMVVSGWYEALGGQLSVMWAGTAFREAHPEIFRYTFHEDSDMAGTYFSDFTAYSPLGLEKKLRELVYDLGGEPDDQTAPNYLLTAVNQATNVRPNAFQIASAAAFAALFMLCGYLLIFNVFDIAVMQDIRRFGLYRTIGMSRKQVRTLINRQALWLSGIGIPLGLLGGFFIGRAALPLIMGMVVTEYQNLAAEVSPSPVLFLSAAALTALTVFCSTRKPVRAAANTPPMEAFRYVERFGGGRSSRRSAPGASIPRLAWSNLGRNRRRTAFIMLSLTLCVVLLNCAGTAADSVDVEKETAFMIRTDFAVVNTASSSNVRGFFRRSDALRAETVADIAARPGVTGGSAIYKNTAEDTNVTYDFGHPLTGETFVMEETGLTFGSDGYRSFGLGDDGRMLCNVYGMEEAALARMDLREGETDAHILYEKMSAGEGVLVGVHIDRRDMSLVPDLDLVDVGQNITVYKNGSPVMKLPVLAKAAQTSDDAEIGYISSGPLKTGGDGLNLYLPAGVYEELYDVPTVYKYSFDIEEGCEAEMTAFLEDYMEKTDPDMNYLSAREARESSEATQRMIRFVGGFVGLIFGLAGVLNLINTIVTTILTRRHEFAAMESVGMTRRQLTGMMVWEGVYYAAGACLLGLSLSAALNLTLVKRVVDSMWQFTFRFTLLPALGACGALLAVSAVVPVLALRAFHQGSIVEQLRVAE
ncbi:ABC transporter permease [uncultured Oscillibacter sp.]|jgi:putative ABC transport system permease protein|uniref:ABC transporter permease n=3 Tax=uncultured Oscillibacter sp. TaxID=876091 RepID=UPI0025D7B589|nr:ABC transporter permease [uncultured Oscillibacter sp.]